MKKKFFITTTIPLTFIFFKGQPRLWRKQYDVCAISSEKERLKQFADEEEIRYKNIPMKRNISPFADFVCILRWIFLLLKERPYIVHGNTPKASLLSMTAAWLTRRRVRIYMCHGLRYQGTEGGLRKLLMVMESITCWCATHVICVSKGVADMMEADGLCKKDKMHVIGYGSAGGVDTEKFNPELVESTIRKDLGISENAFVYSFVGRIVKDKGVNELVNVFDKISKHHENVHLLLVGPIENEHNPIDDVTMDVIEKNSNIHSVGMQQDIRPYLKASNAFVLPSYREGFGMVLIEAGSMGLPCITTDITGCNEIIVPGENGAIIESKNEEALYEVMERWLNNPTLMMQMAKNARKMVVEKYDSNTVRERYFSFYKSL